MIRSDVVTKNVRRLRSLQSPGSCSYAAGLSFEMNPAGMLIMQRDLLNVNAYSIVRPDPVGCKDDAPTSFGMAHSRGIFGPPDSGLRYLKLLR